MSTLMTEWCNIYGAENKGHNGASGSSGITVMGGLTTENPSKVWYCDVPAIGRFILMCEHGHFGTSMALCRKHWEQYKTSIQFCPRCNQGDRPEQNHNCQLTMRHVS